MVMSTMPIKYAVPAGSARTRLLTACAARYTGCTVRGWDVWDGLDTHPASQNSGRFGYSFGKTRILEDGPYEIEAAVDGQEALEAISRQRPNVILLDLLIPRMDGFAVIEYLQQDPRYRDIPVIVLTD